MTFNSRWSSRLTLPLGPQWGDPQNGRGGVRACMVWVRDADKECDQPGRPHTAGGRVKHRPPTRGRPQSAVARPQSAVSNFEDCDLMITGRSSKMEDKDGLVEFNDYKNKNAKTDQMSNMGTKDVTNGQRNVGINRRPPSAKRPPSQTKNAWGDEQPWADRSHKSPHPNLRNDIHNNNLKNNYSNQGILKNSNVDNTQRNEIGYTSSRLHAHSPGNSQMVSNSGRKPPLPPSTMTYRERIEIQDDVFESWNYSNGYKEQNSFDLFDTDAFSPEPISGLPAGKGSYRGGVSGQPTTRNFVKENANVRPNFKNNIRMSMPPNRNHQAPRQGNQPNNTGEDSIAVLEKHSAMNRNNAWNTRDGPQNPRDVPIHRNMSPAPKHYMEPYRPKGLQPRVGKQIHPSKVDYDKHIAAALRVAKRGRADLWDAMPVPKNGSHNRPSFSEHIQPKITTFRDTKGSNAGDFTLRVDCKETPVSSLTIKVTDGTNRAPNFKVASYSPVTRN